MSTALRFLFVEDSEDDTQLILHELRRRGYDPTFKRIETPEDMRTALTEHTWDAILCDYVMPHFSGLAALKLYKESGLDLPFIIVSGRIGEEVAVDAMRAGAHDYILKHNLTRLVPAIEREMREAEVRKERKQAAEALRESEEKYRTILENIKEGYYEVDLSGNYTFFNKSLCELLGRSEDELLGTNYRQSMENEDVERVFQTFNAVYRTRKPTKAFDWTIIRADGVKRSIEASISLVVDSTGEPTGFRGLARDVTERIEAQDTLKESEEKYRTLLQSMHDLVFVHDANDHYVQYYTSSKGLLFVSPEEFMGRHVRDVLPLDVAEQYLESMRRVGTSCESETIDYALEIGGQEYWFSNTLSVHEDGESIVAVVRDITKRKEMEEALRQSEERLRQVIDLSPLQTFVKDSEGRFVLLSEAVAESYGATVEALLGRKQSDVHPDPRQVATFLQEDAKVLEAGKQIRIPDEPFTYSDGTVHWLDTRKIPIQFGDHGACILGVALDITERKRAEEQLRESEERLGAFMDSATDAFFLFDSELNLVRVNAGGMAILSVDGSRRSEDFIGKSMAELTPGESRVAIYEEVVRSGEPYIAHDYVPHPMFGDIYLDLRAFKVGDGLGIITTDITERKRAEEALQESEEWFRAIYEESPIAINVFDLDGNLIHANPALLKLVGVSSVEDLKDLNIFRTSNIPEDAIQRMRTDERVRFQSVIDYAKVKEAGLYNTSKSGVSYVDGGVSPLKYGENGSLHGYMVQMVDVTDRVLAEKEVRASEEKYRGLVERMSEVVFRISVPDGKYEYMSPSISPLIGYHAEEVLDNPLLFVRVVHPDSLEYFKGMFAEMVESNVYSTIEYKIIDTSGNTKWVSQSNSPVYNDEGNLIAVEGICTDVTDRKKAQKDMRTAAETAMLYLDLMGHDIRNHLQAIIMGAEILEQLDIRPEVREMVNLVVNSVENSQNLIEKVQATRDLSSVPPSNTSLREALEDCLQVLNETYNDVQIEVNLGSQQPIVFADKYLGNLLMNILENAIVHNDKRTRRIWLDLREAKGGYEVAIADNGPGIANDRKESLFDQSRRFGGVGVHQAFKIAQKYGGHITVQDRVPGNSSKGAEFHIWFPKSTS